jgi:hypothetical protein
MDLPEDFKVTSELLWKSALFFFLIDLGMVSLLALYVKPDKFRQLKWHLAVATAVVFAAIWTWVLANFWDSVYGYVFPAWTRQFIPPFMTLLFTAVGLHFWWLALRIPGIPVVSYCLLGGLWGMITHLNAIRSGILEKPPLLQGADPAAAVVFAIIEFIFYWCIVTNMAFLVDLGIRMLGDLRLKKFPRPVSNR